MITSIRTGLHKEFLSFTALVYCSLLGVASLKQSNAGLNLSMMGFGQYKFSLYICPLGANLSFFALCMNVFSMGEGVVGFSW